MKLEGLPVVPAVISEDEPALHERRSAPDIPEGLYRDASDQLAESAESVRIAENIVQRRKLELERLKVEDEFAERAQRECDKEVLLRRETAAVEAQLGRNQFIRENLERAAILLADIRAADPDNRIFPSGWPVELSLAVHNAVLVRLQSISSSTPDTTIHDFVQLTVIEQMKLFRTDQFQGIAERRAREDRTQSETVLGILELVKALRT